ncbi:type VII secretion protein EccE [Mycobacterium sp. E342]|uniref:type VII secretion protein EccE n=1 Tax=Mycobacterium sp. E342 TaxID=1834147 RepID=UPI000A74B74A|nr:type VII secretion protein EccE [Mycobacterium sp. E342]
MSSGRQLASQTITGASPGCGPRTSGSDVRVQRWLPLSELLAAEVSVAAGMLTATWLGVSGWWGVAAGLALGCAIVAPVRGDTLPARIAHRAGYLADRGLRARKPVVTDPFDVQTGEGEQIGFRWDGATLLSVLKIDDNPQEMTVLEPGMTVSGEMVPVGLLADCLRQFDITVAAIDIISQGARSYGHTRVAAIYDATLGPLPAIAQRSVFVVVRLDPSRCADAVRRRGGGREGILRTATTATRRVARRLIEAGLRPHILNASGIARATNQLGDGVNLVTVEETRDTCRDGHFRLTSFAVTADSLNTAGLAMPWTVSSYSTTVCLSLRPGTAPEQVMIRGLVRFDGDAAQPLVRHAGLIHLRGLQFSALAASLPVSPPARSPGHWVDAAKCDADGLAVPASGCGQVIGADEQGRAVAVPLFGPQIGRVEIRGTLHLAQQVVLRSLALGARVLVHSVRPGRWRHMVDEVDCTDLLWATDFDRGTIQAGANRDYTVEMFDGLAERTVRAGVTSMTVAAPTTSLTSSTADVTLDLISVEDAVVKVNTRAGSALVTMVATDEEMRYLDTADGDGD